MSVGTILLIVVILILVGVFPTWPHSRSWGYGPSGTAAALPVISSGGAPRAAGYACHRIPSMLSSCSPKLPYPDRSKESQLGRSTGKALLRDKQLALMSLKRMLLA